MDYPLDGCWTKLARATEVVLALDAEVQAWLGPDTEPIQPEWDAETGEGVIRLALPRAPLRWGVLVGDIVHNLRSALDHLVAQLAIHNGEEPSRANQFPMYREQPSDFHAAAQGKLEGVDGDAVRMIEALQPYRHPPVETNELVVLNTLSNADKHRLIHTVAFAERKDSPTRELDVRPSEGRVEILGIRESGGQLRDGAELARFKLIDGGPSAELEVSATFTLQLHFEDGTNVISELSNRIPTAVQGILNSFVPVFGDWKSSSFYAPEVSQDAPAVSSTDPSRTRVRVRVKQPIAESGQLLDQLMKWAAAEGGTVAVGNETFSGNGACEVEVRGSEGRTRIAAFLDEIDPEHTILELDH